MQSNYFKSRSCFAALVLASCSLWLGCGASDKPCKTEYLVTPPTATADHTAPYPSNGVIFMAIRSVSGPCMQPAVMPSGTWSSSDPVNAPIDANNGFATCLAVTPTPATIRFTSSNPAETFPTASLTCR